jgi:hypothetical protein
LYVNLEEARLLCQTTFDTAANGAAALSSAAFASLVTDGRQTRHECLDGDICTLCNRSPRDPRDGRGRPFMAYLEVKAWTIKPPYPRPERAAAVSGEPH